MKRIGPALLWLLCALPLILLIVAAWPSAKSEVQMARSSMAKAQIDVFLAALGSYRTDVGEFPTESQGLQALRTDPGVRGWNGPYLPRDIPRDPWGRPYRYRIVTGRPEIVAPGGGSPPGP